MKHLFLSLMTCVLISACTAIPEAAAPSAEVNNASKTSKLAELKPEFEALLESDQKLRGGIQRGMDQKAMRAIFDQMQVVDKANQARLDELVAQHGWPVAKDVGEKAVRGAFLVVQHGRLDYMRRYESMIAKSAERGDLPKWEFARFDDRLRMYAGMPQRYGTQTNTDEKGIATFWQIEDEANVDKRRAEVGYGPLAEHAKRHNVQYVPYAERAAKETAAKQSESR
ncbi:MAG: hypothetical protein ING60_08820 [Rhodocyclaceae bacterium]|nr:hypothetical protein [Rhodocyclaceae bacterium]